MCIIIAAPPGATPDYDNLIDATWENRDGSGWMIKTPRGLEIVRSARSIDHVLSTFVAARKRWPDSWAVWHSRLATDGTITDANTHPFTIPGTDWALVHNGIMPLTDGPWDSRDRSDSRILAEDHVSRVSWADLRSSKSDTERWLGHDKVVILSGRKERGGSCIILNEKRGLWDSDDCWYSHPLYRPKYTAPSKLATVDKYAIDRGAFAGPLGWDDYDSLEARPMF